MRIEQVNAIFADGVKNSELFQENTLVFGEGNTFQPVLMLIGEAPGAQEVRDQRPFVGKAGKNLDYFLKSIHQDRKDIYITNAVKFRPTKISNRGTSSNRSPSQLEQDVFKPWLLEEIEQVNPNLIVTLGNVPLRVLMGRHYTIGSCHGEIMQGKETGRLVFPLYHPAAIIYNHELKETYERDLNKLKHFLSALE